MNHKLNHSALSKHDFTRLLHKHYTSEMPKITYKHDDNKFFKFKLHFLEIVFVSETPHKSFAKGIKELLTEAIPLLKMTLARKKEDNGLHKISLDRLKLLIQASQNKLSNSSEDNISEMSGPEVEEEINVSENHEKPTKKIRTNPTENKESKNTSVDESGYLVDTDTSTPAQIEYESVNKQEFDFNENFVNYEISDSGEEHGAVDIFSKTLPKKVSSQNNPKKAEIAVDSKTNKNKGGILHTLIEHEIAPVIKSSKESVKPVEQKRKKSNPKSINEIKPTSDSRQKLDAFIAENELESYTMQHKKLAKLHKSIIISIEQEFQSKYCTTPEEAEADVFKKICTTYELL